MSILIRLIKLSFPYTPFEIGQRKYDVFLYIMNQIIMLSSKYYTYCIRPYNI